MQDEGRTAYHEAAHMVVAWELGLTVTEATIVPDSDSLGSVRCPVEDRVRYADWVEEEGYLYSFLVLYFAGVAASEKYAGVSLPGAAVQHALESYGSDHYHAADFILALAGNDPEKQEEIGDRALSHATMLVHVRHEQIEDVAAVLVDRKTLDEGECRRVLENTFQE